MMLARLGTQSFWPVGARRSSGGSVLRAPRRRAGKGFPRAADPPCGSGRRHCQQASATLVSHHPTALRQNLEHGVSFLQLLIRGTELPVSGRGRDQTMGSP